MLNMFIQSIIFLQFFGLISSVSIEEFVRPDLSFRGQIDYVHSFGLIRGSKVGSARQEIQIFSETVSKLQQ
jgi:hypothetical protein